MALAAVAVSTMLNLISSPNKSAANVSCPCFRRKQGLLPSSHSGRRSRQKGDFSLSVALNPSGNFDLSLTDEEDDMEENIVITEAVKSEKTQMVVEVSLNNDDHQLKDFPDACPEPAAARIEVERRSISENKSSLGDVNMEASISTDDVERAGGLGTTDDISSFLPVAMDSTDFEASLREAREFEGPQHEISRPGLGWSEPSDRE